MAKIINCKSIDDARRRHNQDPKKIYHYPVDADQKNWVRYDASTEKGGYDIETAVTVIVLSRKHTPEELNIVKTTAEKLYDKVNIVNPFETIFPTNYLLFDREQGWREI